jgi:hypothetical protein
MFTRYPSYNYFRTLRLQKPVLTGEDVYALQLALRERTGADLRIDGSLGTKTEEAIVEAQGLMTIEVDGLAGQETQTRLAQYIVATNEKNHSPRVPRSLAKGTIHTESGGLLGAFSPQRNNGSYDAGIVQRNTELTDPRHGFDPIESLQVYVSRTRLYWTEFDGLSLVRRWALAAGSWNAPAFACFIAREEGAKGVGSFDCADPGPAREVFEQYVQSVSAYYEKEVARDHSN